MKKFLPVVLIVVGLVVFVGVFLLLKSKSSKGNEDPTKPALSEVPLEKRPVVYLTPTSDGHYLKLKLEKLKLGAKTLDYELLYLTSDEITQGVPGSVDLSGKESYENNLLLGSESSGKFRYDDGVENGTLNLSFRNDKGKLIAKLTTDFHLQSNTDMLTSSDGKFTYKLSSKPDNGFFVVINTLGVPGDSIKKINSGPYAVFSSESNSYSGEVKFESGEKYSRYSSNKWSNFDSTQSDSLGIFLQTLQ